ncbi:MAG TPA: hypothetical protein DCM08_02695 [Microscillaceae bacterium]|jgi:hypothetical protein|nr:hypothetical protein [Microscillaceae bacterium]
MLTTSSQDAFLKLFFQADTLYAPQTRQARRIVWLTDGGATQGKVLYNFALSEEDKVLVSNILQAVATKLWAQEKPTAQTWQQVDRLAPMTDLEASYRLVWTDILPSEEVAYYQLYAQTGKGKTVFAQLPDQLNQEPAQKAQLWALLKEMFTTA